MARSAGTQRPRGTGALALVLGAALLVAAGQVAGRAGPKDLPVARRVADADSPAQLCHLAEVDIDATWDPTKTGAPGYGRIPNFLEAASPYLTSWSLLLSRALGAGLGPVSVSEVRQLFLGDLAHPGTQARRASDSPLNLLLLAVRGLRALHQPIPTAEVQRDLEPLREGGAYRASAGGPTSVSQTTVAAEIAADAGISLPAPVVSTVRAEWPAALRSTTAHEIYARGLPVVASAVLLHAFSRSEMASRLETVLPTWRQKLLAAGSPGVGLGLLALLVRVGHRLGIHLPPPPQSYIAPIEHRSGFLTLFPGTHFAADPQVTLDALETGLRLPRTAARTLEVGRLRQGWVFVDGPASVSATERAVEIERACHSLSHTTSLRTLVAGWVASASATHLRAMQSEQTEKDGQEKSPHIVPINGSVTTGFAVQLEQLAQLVDALSVRLTAASKAAFIDEIQHLLSPAALRSAPLLRLAAAVEALGVFGDHLSSADQTILAQRLATVHPTAAIEIGAADLLASSLSIHSDPNAKASIFRLTSGLTSAINNLEGTEGYRAAPTISAPDIFSTETAAFVLGLTQPATRSAVIPFLTPAGPGEGLATSSRNEVTASSLLAGIDLATGALQVFLSR